MIPNTNLRKLRRIIRRHKLTTMQVADLCRRSRATVYAWRCGNREVPDSALELLELKLPTAAANR